MKYVLYGSIACFMMQALSTPHDTPLTHPILKDIDGIYGIMDAAKIQNTLWLIKEIKNIHTGSIKINNQGLPNPYGKQTDLIFNGTKQTIKSLLEIEQQIDRLTMAEKQALHALFLLIKEYFGLVNDIMMADARGAQEFMIKLIEEFCRKRNRPDSLLLNWKKGAEVELYITSVTDFKVFNTVSTDLMNFLADLIKSCPKAYNAYKATLKKS